MSCCGKKRQAHRAWLMPRPVRLRFEGSGTIALRGAITGKPYTATESTREIDVDPRDAGAFLQDGIFVRA